MASVSEWTFDTLRSDAATGFLPPAWSKPGSWYWNYKAYWSVWSISSVLGVVTAASVFSVGSILSFCSVGSLLSVGSAGSVLSIASAGSVLSVGSTGCIMRMDQNCTDLREPHPITHFWEIRYSAADWDDAASCTKEEYKSDERPDRCDYKVVTCVVNDVTDENCEVRRKGTSTWRELSEKPSFKIKLDDKYTAGTFPCLNGMCPPGETENTWKTKKFTLNNQVVWDGDIDAYEVYRSYMPASLATQVVVALYRDDVLQRNETYAMVENVNDKAFVEKWFGEDIPYRLYEVELGVSKFERGGEEYDDSEDPEVVNAAPTTTKLGMADVNVTNALRYLAARQRANNVDDACGFNNNYYLLHDGTTWYHVPWGADRAFSHPFWFFIVGHHKCLAANECLLDAACKAEYEAVLSEMEANDDFRRMYAVSAGLVSFFVIVGFAVLVAFVCCAAYTCRGCSC
jgi:hypothetical protein